jgi:8-amino-7-oxononanoate synthase
MNSLPHALQNKIDKRLAAGEFRYLSQNNPNAIDFYSNDYLSLAQNGASWNTVLTYLNSCHNDFHGSTGSRLISGNHFIFEETEKQIAAYHGFPEALLFNSGYDANVGLLGCVGQRGDVYFYDELCHASMRDGIRLSDAAAYKFPHQNFEYLASQLQKYRDRFQNIYIVTESVFSMDGDVTDLNHLVVLAKTYNANLIIDEAHALGVIGSKGEGLVASLGLQSQVWACIVTFGKALGCHGAAVLSSKAVKSYLINFSRAFIYTTALPPISVAIISKHYELMDQQTERIVKLHQMITAFCSISLPEMHERSANSSAIQFIKTQNVDRLKKLAQELQNNNFAVKAIFSPTVPKGQERIRICLHAHNTLNQIQSLAQILSAHF